jgi:hypothetical protein
MSCKELQRLSVSDEAAERAAFEAHARDCAACAAQRSDELRIAESVTAWVSDSPAASTNLEERILESVRNEAGHGKLASFPARPLVEPVRRQPPWRWLAAAAAVVLMSLAALPFVMRSLGDPDRDLPQAVREIRQAERAYLQALVALEQAAATKLERAGDPVLPARQAAILLHYEDRLAHLDTVIAEVRSFLDESPGHAGGHTVLLAAYKEKSDVLQEVIDLRLGDRS